MGSQQSSCLTWSIQGHHQDMLSLVVLYLVITQITTINYYICLHLSCYHSIPHGQTIRVYATLCTVKIKGKCHKK